MANYNSVYTGSQIDAAVGKALNPDTTPTASSSALITSGAVKAVADAKAPIASPAFTGNPTAPTQTTGNNSTRLATTAFVKAVMAAAASYMTMDDVPTNGSNNPVKSDGIYDALAAKQDTLTFDNMPDETSSNPVKSKGIAKALDAKAPLASPTLSGSPSAPTAASEDSSTRLATTRFVHRFVDALYANLVDEFDPCHRYGANDYALYNGVIYKVLADTGLKVFKVSDSGKDSYKTADGDILLASDSNTFRSSNRAPAVIADDITVLAQMLPSPPSVDGTYRLTCTVTNGIPAYSWV